MTQQNSFHAPRLIKEDVVIMYVYTKLERNTSIERASLYFYWQLLASEMNSEPVVQPDISEFKIFCTVLLSILRCD